MLRGIPAAGNSGSSQSGQFAIRGAARQPIAKRRCSAAAALAEDHGWRSTSTINQFVQQGSDHPDPSQQSA
ncbi:MAG: hypothetical protein WCI65_11435 [Synechococcaceae cyanobacterium ELA263]